MCRKYPTVVLLCLLCITATANDSIRQNERPRVGLILSGGGAKGIAHVGVLKVLEEVNMPIDYVGGTSMGSIVGGLYSLGYTAGQLEKYTTETKWDDLLTDKVLRQHVSIPEKGERKRYWLQFPIKGRRIDLPLGILSGQNISNLLTELASPAYGIYNFSELPIPFLCIGTDIVSGTEVVLDHGNLAKAMRASMAIPSVFTPEPIDGHMLYDGGLTNNFPADKVREKGIDILIGVDVTSQIDKAEFDNIYKVMEQVVFMASLPLKEANKKMCKILIIPEISEYSASSFNAADSLIARGERAARTHYDELLALADSLRQFGPGRFEEHPVCPQPLPSFYVQRIKINGLRHLSREYVLQKMEIDSLSTLTFPILDKALDRLRGTQAFVSIVYQINPLTDTSVELQLDCVEQNINLFRVGLHYDNDYKASLLLNLTFRNVLLNNSKALIDLSIGENPEFTLSYFQSPGIQPLGKTLFKSTISPDWIFQINGYQIDAYAYAGNKRMAAYKFSNFNTSLKLQISPSVNSLVGGGLIGDYSVFNSQLDSETADIKTGYTYLTYQLFYERDTYNEDYFPTEGSRFRIEGSYNKGISKNVRYSEGLIGVMFRSDFAYTPVKRWTLHSGVTAGAMFGTEIPPQFMIYAGGLPDKLNRNSIRFVGMHFLQEYAKKAWVAHLNSQVRLWSNIYVVFRTNIGKMEDELPDLFTPQDFLIGYGVSLQYNSVVGPLGVTFGSSNITKSLLSTINIGFWF